MIRLLKLSVFTLLVGLTPNADSAGAGVEGLSPQVRSLLTKEMFALENGMKLIFSATISGELGDVEQIARQMKDSFILKQELSQHQMHELHQKLPEEFLKKDGEFHRLAGMLEHVAKQQNTELVGFYYAKLVESCVSCHSEYASHKFPRFSTETSEHSEHNHEH
jgi:hypothetical protein